MDRIVDIATDKRHLSVSRGFLTISEDHEEIGRVPLDDIAAVIVHAHGVTYSNTLFVRLAERGAPLILCAPNHAPVSCVLPLAGHHAQGRRMRAQWDAPKPLHKQLWRQVVVAKIKAQGAILEVNGEKAGAFDTLARKVKSGDPENIEAQAARRYWPLLFGPDFRRDRDADGINSLLNYGYTVLRSLVARSIVAVGLHPGIGIHHHNRSNPMALADDLMEPFRPIVDQAAYNLYRAGHDELDSNAKRVFASLMALDLPSPAGTSPLSVAAQRLARSLAVSFEKGTADLEVPQMPSPLELSQIGARI